MDQNSNKPTGTTEPSVGKNLHNLRVRRGYSLRELADCSELNVNTLSLIENGKSSPSVSTLQQLASALKVPITAFFESKKESRQVVFTPADERPLTTFGSTLIQNLGMDFVGKQIQPLVLTLEKGAGSGDRMIVHAGDEFVYILSGSIWYKIENDEYVLNPGDSLVFKANLAHFWQNRGDVSAQILLLFSHSTGRDDEGEDNFLLDHLKKETTMKIAVITEDGKTISQHFGRAPYYLVLSIEEGKITAREMRSKLGHNQFNAEPHAAEHHGSGHGDGQGSHHKHTQMAEAIKDCKAVLCGGMGMGAYESMRLLNIQPVVTDESDIEKAVQAFLDGKLIDHTELLH